MGHIQRLCISGNVSERLLCSPANVGSSLALAGVDLKIAIALVNANDLALIDLLPRRDEELATILDALQRICSRLAGLKSYQGPILTRVDFAAPTLVRLEVSVQHRHALGGCQ